MNTEETLALLLPLACDWAERQERHILETGVPLSASEMADARRVGVRCPERVRVLSVTEVPMPDNPMLVGAANAAGLLFSNTAGMALRYGIFLRSGLDDRRKTIVHELAHTAQYERLGGFGPFLRQYLAECLTVGYAQCSLEREAVAAAEHLD